MIYVKRNHAAKMILASRVRRLELGIEEFAPEL